MAKGKKMTLEELARMIAKGLENTASKADVEGLGIALRADMKEGFESVELHLSSLGSYWQDRFEALEMRVRKLEQNR